MGRVFTGAGGGVWGGFCFFGGRKLRRLELGDGDASLEGGVAVADSNGIVGKGVKINNDAFGCADFVLFAIAFADIAGIVPGNKGVFFFEEGIDGLGFGDKLGLVFQKRRDAELVGSEGGGEFQDGAVFVFARDWLFGIGARQDG